ncbi:MAG: hypothetical protein ACOC43_15240 [Desulfohalobiaceae bacterium]
MLWAWASLQDPDSLQPLLEPVSSQELEISQVGLAVNKLENDSKQVVKKVGKLY